MGISEEVLKKLRLDAENVLTWKPPGEGDPLLFGHLHRFAKAILSLESRLREAERNTAILHEQLLRQQTAITHFKREAALAERRLECHVRIISMSESSILPDGFGIVPQTTGQLCAELIRLRKLVHERDKAIAEIGQELSAAYDSVLSLESRLVEAERDTARLDELERLLRRFSFAPISDLDGHPAGWQNRHTGLSWPTLREAADSSLNTPASASPESKK